MKTKNNPCEKCGKIYKTLTNENICFSCHTKKYKIAPNSRQFGNHDVKGKK